ncbi:unnamed protein product [Angiostrongylus costaricensis]|uniref:Arrestin_N domain-containing protein n=1 Tax=Angiostrongylus costaricensis TaxID=334426 RepID=A0A0R3PHZ3_ANGCS|nr:unnamed protein product [Angiostrongylus costaricensis]
MSSVTLAGRIGLDGACKGTTYSDQLGSRQKVIVQATIEISVKQMKASANTEYDQIHMPGGLVCKWSAETSIDFEAREVYWRKAPINGCSPERHAVIYEGLAVILNTTHEDPIKPPSITYTVEQDDKVFALRRTAPYQGCAIPAWTTEQPRLPRQQDKPTTKIEDFFYQKSKVSPLIFDLMLYVNAKFVYLDRNWARNFNALNSKIESQICEVERHRRETAIASLNPDEFVYLYMEGPEHIANVMGEVIYTS